MKQTQLLSCQQAEGELPRDDINVTLTIREIPAYLIREFAEKIAMPYYTGGIAEAIKELMWEAVQSQKLANTRTGGSDQSRCRIARASRSDR